MAINKKRAGLAAGTALTLAVAMVSKWEGTKLDSYQDAVGIWTVCTGHTLTAAPNQTRTQAECDDLLASDMGTAFAAVDRYIDVPLEPETHAALASFTFNVGESALQRSTLARLANSGDLEAACNELPRWVYADGQRLRGLVNRRANELERCLEGVRNAEQTENGGAVDSGGPWHWFDVATQWLRG